MMYLFSQIRTLFWLAVIFAIGIHLNKYIKTGSYYFSTTK